MTMVSIPAAMALAPGRSSPSHSPAFTPPPASAFEPVPPTLDVALATGCATGSVDVLRCARLSLMHSIPRVGLAWSLWCGHCGALREVGEHPEEARGRKRDADGLLKAEAEDELEAELNAHFAALEQQEEEEKARGARRPQRRRRAPQCAACGTKFQRPRPTPPPYPSARAARTRRQSALAVDAQAQAKEAELSPAGTLDAAEFLGPAQPSKPAPGMKNVAAGGSAATYPQPKTAPPPQPNGGISTTLPTSPPPAKKRKTKKSGLKQLLAQNAARQVEKGSGNWGLG